MQFSDMLVESSHAAGRSTIHAQHAILPPEVAARISSYFREGNEKFFRNFAKCDNLYQSEWQPEDFIDLREVTFDAASVIDIFSGLLVNLDQRLTKLENA